MRVRSCYPLLIIVGGVTVADSIARLSLGFQINRVAVFEAALFGTASLLLLWLARRDRDSIWLVRIDLLLAGLMGLGGIRAGLWARGLPVAVANLVILAVGLTLVAGLLLRRWVRRRHAAAAQGA